jgi:5-methylcytosine-specific restriction endonuclease McrA
VLARDRGLCRLCESRGITQTGNQIDHILPAEENPELFWAPENLQVLCRKCHGEKTRKGE